MHSILLAAAQKRAWGERPDLCDPTDLCVEVLPSYRTAVAEAQDGDLRRAAEEALEAYEDAEWNGEVPDVAEEFLEGYGKAIVALPNPVPLLDDLIAACATAIEAERSVWLPDRPSVARACMATISSLPEGSSALAESLCDGLLAALRLSDDPQSIHRALCRAWSDLMWDDAEAVEYGLRRAIEKADPNREAFRVVLAALKECSKADPRSTASVLCNAIGEVVEGDFQSSEQLAHDLLNDTRLAIRNAAEPLTATIAMLESLSRALPGGPSPPGWMVPETKLARHAAAGHRGQADQLVEDADSRFGATAGCAGSPDESRTNEALRWVRTLRTHQDEITTLERRAWDLRGQVYRLREQLDEAKKNLLVARAKKAELIVDRLHGSPEPNDN